MAQSFVVVDPEIQGGTPVFCGRRVPIKNLFDFIEEGILWKPSWVNFHRSASRWPSVFWSKLV